MDVPKAIIARRSSAESPEAASQPSSRRPQRRGAQLAELRLGRGQTGAELLVLAGEVQLVDRRDTPLLGPRDRARSPAAVRVWLGAAVGGPFDRRVARSAPPRAGEVDLLERLDDPVLGAELVHRPAALVERAVVVDDQMAPDRQS